MTERSRAVRLFVGGTFNPLHNGHARLALECARQVDATHLAFVPCYLPPHKPAPFVEPRHRLAMVNAVVQELRALEECEGRAITADTFELERREASYTVNTLRHLRAQYPDDVLVWALGMDSLATLDAWHEWQSLTEFANLLVAARPGYAAPQKGAVAEWLADKWCCGRAFGLAGGVAASELTPLQISSTAIRSQLQRRQSPRYLLPESVLTYINEHNLYQLQD